MAKQQEIIAKIYGLISSRPASDVCNFLTGAGTEALFGGERVRVVYRHYATLYFCFVVDSGESELGILDLIQVFVESLDRCFENVCELDLIFNYETTHDVLNEMISGGLVLETSSSEIFQAVGGRRIRS